MNDETLRMTLSIVDDDAPYCHQLLQNFTEIYPVEKWKIQGFFSDSDLLNINCHWMEFEPFEPFVHFTLAIIFNIVLLAGFISNAFVIYIIVWYAILIIIYRLYNNATQLYNYLCFQIKRKLQKVAHTSKHSTC